MAESPRDQFDEVVQQVVTKCTRLMKFVTPDLFAQAFRDHFAQQTCDSCVHGGDCAIKEAGTSWALRHLGSADRFSCRAFELPAKDR